MGHSHPTATEPDSKFQITGMVAGVGACQLISDKDEIVVGSGLECDLVVVDPLVPRRAFRLKRARDHVAPRADCATYWMLESFPQARNYVNGSLAHRSRVEYGDKIALGCHELRFTPIADEPRDRWANTRIDDLCERLMQNDEVPRGFLESCPSWLNRCRTVRAIKVALTVVGLLFLLWLIVPAREKFEQVQLPMEIVMLADRTSSPDPNAVRSLDQVQRKTIPQPTDQLPRSEIRENQVQPVKDLETKPVEVTPVPPVAKPVAPQLEVTAAPRLPALEVQTENAPKIDAPVAKLQVAAPPRRLSVQEAADPVFRRELGEDVQVRIADATVAAVAMPLSRSFAKPAQPKLESDRAAQLAALERFKPSPLRFEQLEGVPIPIARLPGELTKLEVKSGQPTPNPADAIVLDGEVSEAEVAVSWKSGQFKVHGPSPRLAEPPTYCYVGKKEQGGREYLYISFTCLDPNLSQLVLGRGEGATLCRDDSVEIFVDTDSDIRNYNQMIVNAAGKSWAGQMLNQGGGRYQVGPAWDAQAQVKTTINKSAGRWSCEILIPFDRLGGVPAKGARWGVNFCRNFRGQSGVDDHLQTWFSVYEKSRNFQRPELFGRFDW
ncbi:MAG: hypothetical protein PCFJNLEI_02460 [Verrucomicrobiae bacterium]|nr:hypothetical protein [Verrucomicrobiae bacterium]